MATGSGLIMRVVIEGTELPGRTCGDWSDVHVALQVGKLPEHLVSADADHGTWTADVTVTPDGDFRGPAVHGKRGERFLYLTWGELRGEQFAMFRRIKLMLADLGTVADPSVARGTLSLTDRGLPRCGRVVPPVVTWTLC